MQYVFTHFLAVVFCLHACRDEMNYVFLLDNVLNIQDLSILRFDGGELNFTILSLRAKTGFELFKSHMLSLRDSEILVRLLEVELIEYSFFHELTFKLSHHPNTGVNQKV